MKQFVLIVLVAMVSFGSAEACLNKAKVENLEVKGERLEAKGELTILVMDTTQALLPEAEIRFGKRRVWRTPRRFPSAARDTRQGVNELRS